MKHCLVCQYALLAGLVISAVISFADSIENVDAEVFFQQARLLYEAEAYEAALPAFQKAVELAPMNSSYHHLLGKCYGRISAQGNWFTALRYVRKTLAEFRKAVELDDSNIPAWIDLQKFYRQAPGFLGGNKDRAREIRRRLAALGVDEIED